MILPDTHQKLLTFSQKGQFSQQNLRLSSDLDVRIYTSEG